MSIHTGTLGAKRIVVRSGLVFKPGILNSHETVRIRQGINSGKLCAMGIPPLASLKAMGFIPGTGEKGATLDIGVLNEYLDMRKVHFAILTGAGGSVSLGIYEEAELVSKVRIREEDRQYLIDEDKRIREGRIDDQEEMDRIGWRAYAELAKRVIVGRLAEQEDVFEKKAAIPFNIAKVAKKEKEWADRSDKEVADIALRYFKSIFHTKEDIEWAWTTLSQVYLLGSATPHVEACVSGEGIAPGGKLIILAKPKPGTAEDLFIGEMLKRKSLWTFAMGTFIEKRYPLFKGFWFLKERVDNMEQVLSFIMNVTLRSREIGMSFVLAIDMLNNFASEPTAEKYGITAEMLVARLLTTNETMRVFSGSKKG